MKTPFTQNRRQFLGTLGAASSAAWLSLDSKQLLGASSPGAMSSRWWESEYRIVQTNLREIDVLQDPVEIARAVKEFGATALVTNIGGIVAFYPTQLEYQYTNPYLQGDFTGAMFEAARAEGLTVLGRFDLSKAMGKAHEAHPEWFVLNRDGSRREYEGTYAACLNAGWSQGYAFEIMGEAVPIYQADGYFFNMSGYPRSDYSNVDHGICVCEFCQRRFRDMYGLELPQKEGYEDPNWLSYLEFQDRTSSELSARVREFITPINDAPILSFAGYDRVGRGEVQRRFYRSPPEWPHQAGDQARWAMAATPGKPFSSTSAAHLDYPWRQATETPATHKLRFAQQMAVGANLDLYLMGPISAQDDPTYLPPLSELFHWREAHKDFYAGLEPSAKIALYSSNNQSRYSPNDGGFGNNSDAYRGAYKLLVDSRIPFWMVNDQRVADGTTNLQDYDVILMPSVEVVSDAEIDALDNFVENGGTLLVTGNTGTLTERGLPRDRIDFRSFPGTAYGETMYAHGWTANLDTAELQIGRGRMAMDEDYFMMDLRDDVTTLMGQAPEQRFGPPELNYAIPGDPPREEPVVLSRQYGKGTVIHIPWRPDALYYKHGLMPYQNLFKTLIGQHASPQPYVLKGDGPVELMFMHQPATGRDLVHIINYAGQRNTLYDEAPSISGLQLGVKRARASAMELIGDTTLSPAGSSDGYMWFDLPDLDDFSAISVG